MLGAIAGDVLGSVHEFKPVKTKDFELFSPNSNFTDDSVMTVAVAEACMNEESYVDSLQAWGRKYPFAGYGSWFGQWIFSENPEPYNSFGNGSAMRVSSIGWLFDEEERRPIGFIVTFFMIILISTIVCLFILSVSRHLMWI